MPTKKLTRPVVDALSPTDRDLFLWDTDLRGFGIRVKPSGVKTFVIQYRTAQGASRRMAVGQYGRLTVDEARKAAKIALADVTRGVDPKGERDQARLAMTVAQLCARYLAAIEAGTLITRRGAPKAATTVAIDRGRIQRHILPVLGRKLATDLTTADVRALFGAVKSGKTAADIRTGNLRGRAIVEGGAGTAKKSVQLLSAILTFGMAESAVKVNPARGFKLPKDGQREVTDPQGLLAAFGRALALAEQSGEPWQATQALHLIALTGLRHSEAIGLTWGEIDFAGTTTRAGVKVPCLRLTDTKTGPSARPLSRPAHRLLGALRGRQSWIPSDQRPVGDCVFWAQRRGTGAFGGMAGAVRRMISADGLSTGDRAALVGFGAHHLRHAFATIADSLGATEATIAALLGHRRGSATQRYVGRVDAVLLHEANGIAKEIERLMTPPVEVIDAAQDYAVEPWFPDEPLAAE